MANHNLNTEISFSGLDLLVPTSSELNVTNNISGFGSLGLMANNCAADWGRPPNFLLVDYYNVDNGTVFEVAAQHNNVTYSQKCCGLDSSVTSAGLVLLQRTKPLTIGALALGIVLFL